MKFNLGINVEPQMMKITQGVGSGTIIEGIQRCFCMDMQNLKGIPPELA
jgi:hypothetical protein